MENRYQYAGALEPVAVKVVHLLNAPNIILSIQQWVNEGGYKGVIQSFCLSIRDIDRVEDGKMNPVEFDQLEAWEG